MCVILFLTSRLKVVLKSILEISGEIRGEFSWMLLHSLKSLTFGSLAVFIQRMRRGSQRPSPKKPFCNSSNHQSPAIIVIRAEISHDLHHFCGIKGPKRNPQGSQLLSYPLHHTDVRGTWKIGNFSTGFRGSFAFRVAESCEMTFISLPPLASDFWLRGKSPRTRLCDLILLQILHM